MNRSPGRPTSPLWAALVCVALWAPAGPAAADVYKWEDEQGVIHFSQSMDAVPIRHRSHVEVIGMGGQAKADRGLFDREPAVQGADPGDAPAPDSLQGDPSGPTGGPIRPDTRKEPPGFGGFNPGAVLDMLSGTAALGVLLLLLVGSAISAVIISLFIALACRLVLGESPSFLRGIGVAYAQMAGAIVVQIVVGVAAAILPLMLLLAPVAVFLVNAAALRLLVVETFGKSLLVSVMVVLLQLSVVVLFAVAFVTFASNSTALPL